VAVLLGLVALAGIHSYVKKKEIELRGDTNTVKVLVAKDDIAAMEELVEDMVEVKEVPEEYLPMESIKASELSTFLGQEVQEPVKAGQYLMTHYFLLGRERGTVEARITPGKRAMTIRVDDVTGLSGLLRPGCYVDVIGTFDVELKYLVGGETRNTDTVTKTLTILRRRPVLAVGSMLRAPDAATANPYQDPADMYASVTLEVTPEEAQRLSFAQSKGQLSLVLRNKDDISEPKEIPAIDMESLMRDATGAGFGAGVEAGTPKTTR
jgi:pilus assembly protein CpaB